MPDNELDRRRLRAAFERSVGRPRPGVAERVIAGIAYDREPARHLRLAWLAVPVAVILALAIVYGLLASRHTFGTRPVPAASGAPVASGARSSVPNQAVAPPVLASAAGYFTRPDRRGVLFGQPWTGDAVEVKAPIVIGTTPEASFGAIPSPDGSRFLAVERVYDADGKVLGDAPSKSGARWADDSRHLCWMARPAQEPGAARLTTWQPGEPGYEVASIGSVQGQSGPTLASCSFTADRAVIYQMRASSVAEIWLLKLSNGAILFHEVLAADQGWTVVSSHDGRMIAENNFTAGTATILDTAQGSRVTLRDRQVVGFSWDGSRAVVRVWQGLGSPPGPAELYDVQAARGVWKSPDGSRVGLIVAEPGGARVLISLTANLGESWDLWVVGPDGNSRRVATDITPYLTR